MPEQLGRGLRTHILSIAFEDYFHGPAFSKIISRSRWDRFESRFEQNCVSVLERLESTGSRATFFANAWVARNCPDLLRAVVSRGHEIALAGQRGISFRLLSPETLREQVRRDRDILEQACGRRIAGFRVTDVLLGPRDLWALEVLAQEGFSYDSSFSPFLRAFAAEPWRQYIHNNQFSDGSLWEVPLASQKIAGLMIPIAGGNYFRQFPEWLVKTILNRWDKHCPQPLVLYFRLWDFDPMQPRLRTGSLWRNFRHYRNGERMVSTLDALLTKFQFTSISDYLNLVPLAAAAHLTPTVASRNSTVPSSTTEITPISVIVPCFNEEAGIPYLARSLDGLKSELGADYEVQFILVDDGSRDGTWNALKLYFSVRPDTQLVRHPQNRGVSAAIMTGLERAREIACSIDCDCSYEPGELKPMLRLLEEGVDLVTASPYHPEGAVLNVPQWRLFLSRCSSFLYRLVTGRKFYTFTACMRVYRRSAALGVCVKNPGFLGVAELFSQLVLHGSKIVEHPATLEVRIFGQSKMKVIRNVCGHLALLVQLARIRMQNRRTGRLVNSPRVGSQKTQQSAIVSEVEL